MKWKGKHHIHCQLDLEGKYELFLRKDDLHLKIGPTCGVIPVSAPAVISSHGLKWDMSKGYNLIWFSILIHRKIDNLHCHFGGVISTSNVLDNELIEITTDSPVVWTVEIKSFVQ